MQTTTSIVGSNHHPLQISHLSSGRYFSITQLSLFKWQPDKYYEYLIDDNSHFALSQNQKLIGYFQQTK